MSPPNSARHRRVCSPRSVLAGGIVALVALAALTAAGDAHAVSVAITNAPRVDQSYDVGPASSGSVIAARIENAQTFTAGLTGTLTAVEVRIARHPKTPAGVPLTLDVRRTTPTGAPVESDTGPDVLASSTKFAMEIPYIVPGGPPPATFWVRFDVPAFNVAAGEVVAIVLRTPAGPNLNDTNDIPFIWASDPAGTYAGGRAFARGVDAAGPSWGDASSSSLAGSDLAFRTIIAPVPLPAAAAAGLTTLAGLLLARRRTTTV
jgi:hypothetical protein